MEPGASTLLNNVFKIIMMLEFINRKRKNKEAYFRLDEIEIKSCLLQVNNFMNDRCVWYLLGWTMQTLILFLQVHS